MSGVSGCRQVPREAGVQEQSRNHTTTIDVKVVSRSVEVSTPTAEFEILSNGYLRASLKGPAGRTETLDDPDTAIAANPDYLIVAGREVRDFALEFDRAIVSNVPNGTGFSGKRIEVIGHSASVPDLEKEVTVEVREDFPGLVVTRTAYHNRGGADLTIKTVVAQTHRFSAPLGSSATAPYDLWSFQGASEKWGLDEVVHISKQFSRQNKMQEVIPGSPGTGGGIPVVAFWNGEVGEAIGHFEKVPVALSMPVKVEPDGKVHASIELQPERVLGRGDEYTTPATFVAVYHGDFYEPLRTYSQMLAASGWRIPKPSDAAYKPNWCGWGYELNFTAAQMTGTIPKLKELGIDWATLDAGWFNVRGDWEPRAGLDREAMQRLVEAFHKEGIKLTLWWIPIVAEDRHGTDILDNRPYKMAEVVKQHPDWLILDKNGKHARMTSDMAGLCPAVPEVRDYYRHLTERFIRDWDFDGHKLDFSYSVPPCYNPKHHHQSPDDSTRAMGDVYKIIFDTTRALKPESVTQSCPCGTPPNFAWLPYLDQAVTADPVGSLQVRRRIKMYKALLGPSAAVYGDHVELTRIRAVNTSHESDQGRDFASTVGLGAVPGTKFTWPDYGKKFQATNLTAEKEALWKKWLRIYKEKELSRGIFRDLYVYGYDSPEGYAVEKNGTMHYAFFTPETSPEWKGRIELRGLKPGRFRIVDYENGLTLGAVDSARPEMNVQFREHLLLEADPL